VVSLCFFLSVVKALSDVGAMFPRFTRRGMYFDKVVLCPQLDSCWGSQSGGEGKALL
jgi:hypothetical protein